MGHFSGSTSARPGRAPGASPAASASELYRLDAVERIVRASAASVSSASLDHDGRSERHNLPAARVGAQSEPPSAVNPEAGGVEQVVLPAGGTGARRTAVVENPASTLTALTGSPPNGCVSRIGSRSTNIR